MSDTIVINGTHYCKLGLNGKDKLIPQLQAYKNRLNPQQVRMWDVLWGMHSNIPLCCVMWFSRDGGRPPAWTEMTDRANIRHNRCPRCREIDRVAEIHHCSDDCIPELHSTYRLVRYYENVFELIKRSRKFSHIRADAEDLLKIWEHWERIWEHWERMWA